MLVLEKRAQPSQLWTYLTPIIAVISTMLIGGALFGQTAVEVQAQQRSRIDDRAQPYRQSREQCERALGTAQQSGQVERLAVVLPGSAAGQRIERVPAVVSD